MAAPHVPPKFELEGFNCPQCEAFAHQIWSTAMWTPRTGSVPLDTVAAPAPKVHRARCSHCQQSSFWVGESMLWPSMLWPSAELGPPPADDLPPDVAALYDEARSIAARSPRAAAALLRLAIDRLCRQLGCRSSGLNDCIAELVQNGLPVRVQQALDVVRVTGNDAVHPGQLTEVDDVRVTASLFGLVNMVCDTMITQPASVEQLYGSLPGTKREHIERRDRPPPPAISPA